MIHALNRTQVTDAEDHTTAYTQYDKVGNRLRLVQDGTQQHAYAYDSLQYTGVGSRHLGHDGNGNLTFDGSLTYERSLSRGTWGTARTG